MKKNIFIAVLPFFIFTHCSKNKDNADLQKGLQAHFKLDGAFSDLTGHISSTGHIGTINFITDRHGTAQGAASFGGGYFWFDFPENFSATPMTISFWVKLKDLTKEAYFIKTDQAGFGINQNKDKIHFVVSTPVTDGFGSTVTTGWSHIAGTYDGTNVKLYINGEYKGYEVNPGDPGQTIHVEIGTVEASPFNWEGSLDDIRFYNRILSKEEIKMLAEE